MSPKRIELIPIKGSPKKNSSFQLESPEKPRFKTKKEREIEHNSLIERMMARYKDLDEDEADAVLLQDVGLDDEGNEIVDEFDYESDTDLSPSKKRRPSKKRSKKRRSSKKRSKKRRSSKKRSKKRRSSKKRSKKRRSSKKRCSKMTTKKYTSEKRKSPPYSAEDCHDKSKKGLDGFMYISEKRGCAKYYRWYKKCN
jgi:hypothetical protein